jgi:hypothetical protein
MSDERSTAELEQEAERVRAEMAYTAESLRSKMSPGSIVDEFTGYMKGGDASAALSNLKNQIRDNPLPLALIGVGLAWLFAGGGPTADRLKKYRSNGSSRGYRSGYAAGMGGGMGGEEGYPSSAYPNAANVDEFGDDFSFSDSDDMTQTGSGGLGYLGEGEETGGSRRSSGHSGGITGGLSSAASSAANAISGAASSLVGAASSVGSATTSAAGSLSGGARRAVRGAGKAGSMMQRAGSMMQRRSREVAGQTQRTFSDMLEREPMMVAAMGVAAGAAIGAMLPRTSYEDEYLGPQRDKLRETLTDAAQRGLSEAKDVAGKALDAVKEEGFIPSSGESIAEKVSRVAGTVTRTVEEEAKSRLGSDKQQDTSFQS